MSEQSRKAFEAWALLGRPASAWDNWQLCWQAARQATLAQATQACEAIANKGPALGHEGFCFSEGAGECVKALRAMSEGETT